MKVKYSFVLHAGFAGPPSTLALSPPTWKWVECPEFTVNIYHLGDIVFIFICLSGTSYLKMSGMSWIYCEYLSFGWYCIYFHLLKWLEQSINFKCKLSEIQGIFFFQTTKISMKEKKSFFTVHVTKQVHTFWSTSLSTYLLQFIFSWTTSYTYCYFIRTR